MKNYQNILKLLLSLTVFAMMSGCSNSAKPTVNSTESSPANMLTKENKTEKSPTPSAEPSAEQSNNQQEDKPATGNDIVTFNSFGKVKVGMTISEASQALGTELVRGDGYEDSCYYLTAKQGYKDVLFMVTNEKIARIDVRNKTYATDKGAKIGDTEAKIKELYKGIVVSPQKYDEKKHDMEIYSDDKKFMIIFETDGKIVTEFRAGNAEGVGYVEGCS